jgi:hypothetical protein
MSCLARPLLVGRSFGRKLKTLMHLNEKMVRHTIDNTRSLDISIYLEIERTVTKHGLLICKDAASHIDCLRSRISVIL